MQHGRALERLIREVVIVDPELIPLHVLKGDFSDGFYRIGLRTTYDTKLGIVFLSEGEDKELVEIMLTLPMGWKNLPPIFYMATETVSDIPNT